MYKPFQNITIIVIAWITIATGITVMAGWVFNIPILQTIVPGFIAMKFNPALCFVLFGSALLFTQYKKHRLSTPLFFILSILGTLIGTITLCQDLFHFNASIDQFFITDKTPVIPNFMFPGRMAFNSSLSFMLLGFGFLTFNTKSRLLSIISQCLFQIVIVLTAFALIGYLYGSFLLSALFSVTTMAVHTAILFLILSSAASLLNPSIGITRLFTGKQVGNQMAKRLYTLMIVMVILVGAFRLQIQDQQLPTLSFKTVVSLLAIGFLLISLLLIWNTANWLNRIDTQRSEAEEKIKQMNAGLEKIVEERSTEFQKSEEKYRSLIEQASDAIYILNFHGNFTDVNASMCRMIGYSREELLQLNIESIIDPYELKVDPLPKQMDNTKESIIRERRFRNKNGKVFTVEVNVKKFTDRIMVIARDITDRKKTEEELKSSEQKYRLLFDSNPMPMWMITKDDQNIIAVNDAAAFHYGYSKDELLNTHVKALRPVEDLEQQLEGYRTEVNPDIIRVVRHVKKDGSIMFVHIISHDIIFEGRPVRLSMTNDITEKLNAEESLQKSEANLQAILKTTDTAYALFDKNLKVLAFNQKAVEFVRDKHGHVPEKGDKLTDYFPKNKFPAINDFAKDVLKGNNVNYEVDYPLENGSVVWYYERLFPIINDNKEIIGMLMALYDITQRKNAEQDLKSAYERIQNHINSIKDMAWKQSHLIRSPLANLKGLVAMLEDTPSDAEIFNHIQNELNRMDTIILEMAEDASDHE